MNFTVSPDRDTTAYGRRPHAKSFIFFRPSPLPATALNAVSSSYFAVALNGLQWRTTHVVTVCAIYYTCRAVAAGDIIYTLAVAVVLTIIAALRLCCTGARVWRNYRRNTVLNAGAVIAVGPRGVRGQNGRVCTFGSLRRIFFFRYLVCYDVRYS